MNEYHVTMTNRFFSKETAYVYADFYKQIKGTKTYEFYRDGITNPVLTLDNVTSIENVEVLHE